MHLVVGATGRLGGAVATRLLARGEPVRVLVRPRDPDRDRVRAVSRERLRALGAEIVEGDLIRPDTVARALEGVRCVISTASATKRAGHGTLATVDVAGTATLARAAGAAGVHQMVYVSAHLADPRGTRPVLREKGLAEQAIAASGVPATLLRPTKFMQDWIGALLVRQLRESAATGTARVQLVGAGDVPVSFVDEDDVVALAVAVLGGDATIGETLTFATEVDTYRGLVERLERLAGAAVALDTVAVGERVTTLEGPAAATVTALLTSVATAPADTVTTPEVAARFGLRPSGIDAFLRRALAD
jgi:uncharacterized protein YbjT (DUF2867 family)